METCKLLLVDDDDLLFEFLKEGLAKKFNVISTASADEAYVIATRDQPDLMLIDIFFQGPSGIDLCQKLRANLLTRWIPIIVITGMGDREKMFSAYEAGVDDYIEKPIDIMVLENRITSRLKRMSALSNKGKSIANMQIFMDRSEVLLNGKTHKLSQTELSLLRIFISNINKNVTREELMKSIWADSNVEQRTVDVHISSLRRKLKDFDYRIEALYGSGYILRPHHSVSPVGGKS